MWPAPYVGLLQFERGDDGLVDGPCEGGHHAPPQHPGGEPGGEGPEARLPVEAAGSRGDPDLRAELEAGLHHVGGLGDQGGEEAGGQARGQVQGLGGPPGQAGVALESRARS